jgi:hypothetical protein
MVKIIFFGLLLFFFGSSIAKQSSESQQEILNRVAKEADTIFVGRVLRKMEINQGLVYANGNTISLGILEMEVLKTYRGKEANDKKQLVCTWFGSGEFTFDPPIGRELLIFGIQVGSIVQIPMIQGYIRGIPEDESQIFRALRLKQKKIKDKSNIFATFYSDSKVIRNACNEPIVWHK